MLNIKKKMIKGQLFVKRFSRFDESDGIENFIPLKDGFRRPLAVSDISRKRATREPLAPGKRQFIYRAKL